MDDIDRQTQALSESIKSTISELAGQISSLNERYRRITGQDCLQLDALPSGNATGKRSERHASTPQAADGKSKRRIRRTKEQLTEQAESILTFIKKAGTEGVKGSAIRAEFGPILPSVKVFLKQYGSRSVKTKGEKAAMTYHVSD